MKKFYPLILLGLLLLFSCKKEQQPTQTIIDFGQYSLAEIKLHTPVNTLQDWQKQVLRYLVRAATFSDSIYLLQNAGDYASMLYTLTDEKTKLRFQINYGPWDIFHNNLPFIDGVPTKPKGAYFYPQDMVVSEFYNMPSTCKFSHYTMIRRDRDDKLMCVPYHTFFSNYIDSAIFYIDKAISVSQDTMLTGYLKTLCQSLKTDNYFDTYKKFVNLDTKVQFIFGPLDISTDKLFNIKADYQAFVLIKNDSLSRKLNQYAQWLPYLQKTLPVPEEYRKEEPGKSSIISVYDAVFLGGSAKAGVPVIATTIPFNAQFQLAVGTKNLQFKNVIKAKYNGIIQPLAKKVIVPSQAKYITPEAFETLSLLYEIGNSLGIRNTIDGQGSVRQALRQFYTVSQYVKNYLMVLFLAEKLHSVDELKRPMKEYYYTFVVNLIRGIRWGSENDYGMANLLIINYLHKKEAITYLPSHQIIINYDVMKKSIQQLLSQILIIQGNGDLTAMQKLIMGNKYISTELRELVHLVNQAKIPIDIYIKPEFKF